MPGNPTPAFSDEVMGLVTLETQEMMRRGSQMAGHAYGMVAKFEHVFAIQPEGDLRHLHNQYVDAIYASHSLKYALLNISIIEAVNRYDFLSYALAARSLIETTATVRHYIRKKIAPLIKKLADARITPGEDLQQLINHEDRLLRGARFNWETFLTKGFEPLASEYRDWLRKRKREGAKARRWEADPLVRTQINAATCLEAWAEEDAKIGVLYDLFCDMVHPNIGSTLCIATPAATGIRFSVDQRQSTGIQLFELSYAPLQIYVAKEFIEQIYVVIHLKFADDELR